jgi:Ricin-type beta-trefoil lectin domain-like
LLDAFPPKSSENENQLWEFVPDPANSGYYFIKSKLSGNVIDIQDNPEKTFGLLDAFPQKKSGADNQLWEFIREAGTDYFFIRSKLDGRVIDIQQASKEPGARLDVFPQKTANADNQLWKAVGGEFPGPFWTTISWGPEGTGPAPNSSTVQSGGNELAYQVSLSISQSGSCTFSGYYQNRGDVWWGTAPPQAFVVVFYVYDTSGKVYAFTYSGEIPSAPQPGSLITWNKTFNSPVIAENWHPIAAKNSGGSWYWNRYDETIWTVLGQWFGTFGQDLEKAASDIVSAFQGGDGGSDGQDDGSDDEAQARRAPLPPLPAKAPTGAAATVHKASPPQAGKGGVHKS